jgi:SecD/SecF fusion protein
MPEYKALIASWGEPILQGDDLALARPQLIGGKTVPEMNFSPEGARKMEDWSRRVLNRREFLASVLDDVVLSIAPIQENTILRESAYIQGTFETDYVTTFTELLNSGSLPVGLNELSSQKVDPQIGQQALDKMVMAGIAAFGFTALFLVVYYAFPGFIALIALGLYVLFTIAALKVVGATFSLAAIAGFILSVGMAVDANILVFERFKEEMKSGKSLQKSIELGFSRALPAIVDSNACTILTSLVLFNLGTGPVKGFAFTLIMGVAISLFTAVVVTRSLLIFFVGSGIANNPKWYALERNWFGEKYETRADTEPFKVLQKSKTYFAISLISILVFLPFMFMGGLKLNVDFKGGYEVELAMQQGKTAGEVQRTLRGAGFEGANVKLGAGTEGPIAIVSVPLETAQAGESPQGVSKRIAQAGGFAETAIRGSSSVGPTIQAETTSSAIWGVIISSALIILYLAFRFGVAAGNFILGLRFGFSAILALVHDVLVVIGLTALVGYLLNWEISALFITSMLTVIGFSVHDTIVIFDRIRENLRKPLPNEDFQHLVNRSITQSFARSLNTSITVIATLVILLAWGTTTPDLKLFMVTMLAGIISGTYSSIFNASPILYFWDLAVGKKKGEAHTLIGNARREAATAPTRTVVEGVPQTAPAGPVQGSGGRTYGQVRRRANAKDVGRIDIEEP